MCYMHWLSCMCHCFHHAVKNPALLIHSLELPSFLLKGSLVCMRLSSLTMDSRFIWANNKMNYLFSRHDPGLLEEWPSLRKKPSSSLLYLTEGKEGLYLAGVSSFLHGLYKYVHLFFDDERLQLLESIQSRVHLNWVCKSQFFHNTLQLAKVVECKKKSKF